MQNPQVQTETGIFYNNQENAKFKDQGAMKIPLLRSQGE